MIHFLIALALCYVLIKIPFWALGSIRGGGRSFVGSLVRGLIAYKTFGLLRGLGSGKASKLRAGGQKSAASTDPYARTRTTSTGQYMLPLNVKRVPTSPRRQTGPPPKPRPSGAGKGRQLALPLDGEWPENKPRLGRDGQYRLPFEVQRQPKPTPPPTAPSQSTSSTASRGRQLAFPADGQWPENKPRLGKDGQYQLPLNVQRTRKPAPPPAAEPAPRARRSQQQSLPLNLTKVHPPRPSTRRGGER
ncbi:hypothetical protein GCM10025787_60590 [Saccharopolyspora rosea]